jgi:excisionase family DNA binding protein
LEKAENSKQKLDIEITELKLKIIKQAKSNVERNDKKTEDKALSEPDSPATKSRTTDSNIIIEEKEIYTVLEAADHWGVSRRTIDSLKADGEIEFTHVGRSIRFSKIQLREIGKVIDRKENEKQLKQQKPGIAPESEKLEHHFTFKISLEPFTNVFVKEGYLDNENATLRNDRFSKDPKPGSDNIEWKKDLQSLMTFIYLADRLGFIDKSKSTDVREHNSSFEEKKEKENEEERREVKFQVFIKENFIITKKGWSKSQFSKEWKHINEAIKELRKQVAKRKGIKIEYIEENITRKETIEYYFNNKTLYFRIENTKEQIIDKKMLDIISDLKSTK